MPSIKIACSDDVVLKVDVEVACVSLTLKTAIEEIGVTDGSDVTIPITAITSHVMEKIIVWLEYHKDDPKPADIFEEELLMYKEPSPWDVKFMKENESIIFEFIIAAGYLGIPTLQDFSGKCASRMINGKTSKELKRILIYNEVP